MTNIDGKIAPIITIFSNVGKKKRSAKSRCTRMIRKALADFMKAFPGATFVAISSRPFRHAVKLRASAADDL
jgi:hypothetical protein